MPKPPALWASNAAACTRNTSAWGSTTADQNDQYPASVYARPPLTFRNSVIFPCLACTATANGVTATPRTFATAFTSAPWRHNTSATSTCPRPPPHVPPRFPIGAMAQQPLRDFHMPPTRRDVQNGLVQRFGIHIGPRLLQKLRDFRLLLSVSCVRHQRGVGR